MNQKAVFEGLVVDERDQLCEVVFVGSDPCYVVDDAGFRRHIPAEEIDKQVLMLMKDMISGHEDIITDQAAQMLGQDDIFSRARITDQLSNIEDQFGLIMQQGLPENQRAYMGMMGFKIRINVHGEVVDFEQPGMIDDEE
jgi:hypothetical protein